MGWRSERRFLEEEPSSVPSINDCFDDDVEGEAALKQILYTYVPILVGGLLVFCFVRKMVPRVYATRQWVPEIKCSLADEQFGLFSWMWKTFYIDSQALMTAVGMDATCFLRLMDMGFRLSIVGVVNSFVLLPLYSYATKNNCRPDSVESLGVGALHDGATEFVGTIVASYIFHLYAMYTILKEFRWFLNVRGKWLRRFKPRNYTVLVRNIPEHLRNDKLLKLYYEKLYGEKCVLAAHVLIHCSKLDSQVDKRKACIGNLEHALAELAIRGKRPTHMNLKEKKVDSIDFYTEQLNELNEDIRRRIDEINKKQRPATLPPPEDSIALNDSNSSVEKTESGRRVSFASQASQTSSVNLFNIMTNETASLAESAAASAGSAVTNTVSATKKEAHRKVEKFVDKGKDLLAKEEDGVADDAAFVTFTRLTAANGAVQMNQSEKPYVLEGEMAPDKPEYLFWKMVGKDKEARQGGYVLSMAATVALCLFWTVILGLFMNFVDGDKHRDSNPGLASFLNILDPILFNTLQLGILPVILKLVSKLELLPADSVLEASAFWKMAMFSLIQNFFVNVLSGGVESYEIIAEPIELFQVMAKELPGKVYAFISSMMVTTCIGTVVELFRVVPLIYAFFRLFFGRRLTKKERAMSCGPFKPFGIVDKVIYSKVMNRYILFYMVLNVYTALTPIVNWFTAVLFCFASSIFRHQFIFIYPNTPDSGGQMWLIFMKVQMILMLLGQIVSMFFFLWKNAFWGMVAMIPLLVIQCLFTVYLSRRHFKIGSVLPAYSALQQDLENKEKEVDFSVFEDSYLHPALKEPFLDADWNAGKFEDEDVDDNNVEDKEKGKEDSSEVVTLLDAIDEIPAQEISQDTTDAKDSPSDGEKASIGLSTSLDAIDETSSKDIDSPNAGETEAEEKDSYVDKMSKAFWD